jgi:hypothetical protein
MNKSLDQHDVLINYEIFHLNFDEFLILSEKFQSQVKASLIIFQRNINQILIINFANLENIKHKSWYYRNSFARKYSEK